jgi:hypothetical protein
LVVVVVVQEPSARHHKQGGLAVGELLRYRLIRVVQPEPRAREIRVEARAAHPITTVVVVVVALVPQEQMELMAVVQVVMELQILLPGFPWSTPVAAAAALVIRQTKRLQGETVVVVLVNGVLQIMAQRIQEVAGAEQVLPVPLLPRGGMAARAW